ncbi:MAG: lanthionine synthetase LanC family protein, partial [Dehalococcoidia bacterium]
GRSLPITQIVAWGRELAAMLETVHGRGFLYRDLKSTNVIVAPDGRLRLIDFDIADSPAEPAPRSGKGTRGYASPQQRAAEAPAVTDDVYGLGALLYFLATGAEPSYTPDQFALLDRPVTLLNPATSPALAGVIARCLDPDAAMRYPSMEAVDAALAEAGAAPPASAPSFGSECRTEMSEDLGLRHRALGRRLADTVCRAARPAPNGHGLAWATRHPTSAGGTHTRDLNTGNAGTVLALAELVAAFGDPRHRKVLAEGARWLAVAPPFEGEPLPGLYVGEAGIGAALLRAGQVLGDAPLIDAAVEKGRLIASLPFGSPDLFNGTAGRLRFHLLLWDETREEEHLAAAIRAGDSLLAAAEETTNGGLRWPIPPGYEGLSGAAYLGYAHGAAGIADALLDLYEVTGDTRLRDAVRGAADWLMWLAVPVLDDGSGLGWPALEGHEPSPPLWCHGAAGIGRFFLHADQLGIVAGAVDVAAAAAHATARAARWTGPTQCHGLAGSIELLLDMFQATGDRAYLTEARSLAGLLEAFASERDGALVFPAESPDLFTPDYMVGYAGVALSLLRLGDPERQPHQLSRRGFRHRPAAESGA